MAKPKSTSKCKFVVYHGEGDAPPSERVVTRQPFSHQGWSRAMRKASEVALGIDRQFGGGKRDTFVEIECSGHAMPLMYCVPDFGKELCTPYLIDDRNTPSRRELAGTARRPRRPRRRRR